MTRYNIDKTLPPDDDGRNILKEHAWDRNRSIGDSPVQRDFFEEKIPEMQLSDALKNHIIGLSQNRKRLILSRLRSIEWIHEYRAGESVWYLYTQWGGIQEKEVFRAIEKLFKMRYPNSSQKQDRLFFLNLQEFVRELLPKAQKKAQLTMEQVQLEEIAGETKMLVQDLLDAPHTSTIRDELTSILVALTEKNYTNLVKLRGRVLELVDAERHAEELWYTDED